MAWREGGGKDFGVDFVERCLERGDMFFCERGDMFFRERGDMFFGKR